MRDAFFALTLLGLMLRVLVPPGYMPVAQDGRLSLQLCPSYAPAQPDPAASVPGVHAENPDSMSPRADMDHMRHGEDQGDAPPGDRHATSAPCTFSGGFVVAVPAMARLPVMVPALGEVALRLGPSAPDVFVRRLAAPPPDATGPPSRL